MSVNVFTQFSLSGPQCDTNNVFVINKCSKLCSGTGYAEVSYDLKANDYVFTVYQDNECTVLSTSQDPLPFGCNNGEIGSYEVTCSNPAKTYDQFKISGQKGSVCSPSDIIDLNLNTCGRACGVRVKIVPDSQNIGYSMNFYEDDQCTSETDSMDFTCQPNNENVAVGDYINVACVSDTSSSSNVVYSLVLIASAALLNVFF